jgi:hypothetical protein
VQLPIIMASSSSSSFSFASFSRLATVEVQLVLQCCDLAERLALARCSRATLAAARHPFAWATPAGPVRLRLRPLVGLEPALPPAAVLSSSLLRYVSFAVRWENVPVPASSSSSSSSSSAFPALVPNAADLHNMNALSYHELNCLWSVPRLTTLDASERKGYGMDHSSSCWERLLDNYLHPGQMRSLKSLHVNNYNFDKEDNNSTSLRLLVNHLPALTELGITGSAACRLELYSHPHLTSLTVRGYIPLADSNNPVVEHSYIARCTNLRELHTIGSFTRQLVTILSCANMVRSLRVLSLQDFSSLHPMSQADLFVPVFEKLASTLEDLRMDQFWGIEHVLRHVPLLASLRRCVLGLHWTFGERIVGSVNPVLFQSGVRDLRARVPACVVEVHHARWDKELKSNKPHEPLQPPLLFREGHEEFDRLERLCSLTY